MLTNPTLDKLNELRLHGMAKNYQEQHESSKYDNLGFDERLGFMADREITERENRRLSSRLRQAKFRQQACVEDIDYRQPRGLDKSLMLSLNKCDWLKEHLNILITGPCGAGKSYIACALGHKACLEGYKVYYIRANRLFEDLALARGDGRYTKIINSLSKTNLLIIDDWGLSALIEQQRIDLLEILEARHGLYSTIITSQLPVKHWHEIIGNPTLADAILDRLIHNAYKIDLKGESMRKTKNKDDK